MTVKEKSPYSSFILAFEPRRTEKIEERLYMEREASESFSAMDWTFERREVVLLVLDPEHSSIGAAALMERMHGSGGTGKLKMRFSEPVLFAMPIHADELRDVIELHESISTAENLERLDAGVWAKLLQRIKELRPDSAPELDTLIAKREEDRRLLGNSNRIDRLIEQRDALGLSLDIAGVDRPAVLRSLNVQRVDKAMSVLDLLEHEPLHEQDAIRHDEQIFEGLLSITMRHARFQGNVGRAVRIYVYDKKRLESVLGIDLLIYQESYKSFLLIQYKTMNKIPVKNENTWSYLADSQIKQQMRQMELAQAVMNRQPATSSRIWDWRLNSSPFYFKFCETTRPAARDDSLVRGLTISAEHLKLFLSGPESIGDHGGHRVGYHNCPRYLNNTQFVELAREGWIGCDQRGYKFIKSILEANKKGGRRAMFAVVEGSGAESSYERGWRHK